MKKYAHLSIVLWAFIFYISSIVQNKTASNTPEADISSRNFYSVTRNIIQDKKSNLWIATFLIFFDMMTVHLPILFKILWVISSKIKKEIFGIVRSVLMEPIGYFLVMMKSHCLVQRPLNRNKARTRNAFGAFRS